VTSEFGYRLKHVRVRAEHENKLTVLVECEWLFENTEKRRERSSRVVGSYDSGAPSKKNVEIKLRFRFEQGLIEKKGWRMGTTMGYLMVLNRIEEK
jgi:hypothetical protein